MATEGAPGGNEAAVGYAPPCAPSCSPRAQPGAGTSTAQGTRHSASRQLPEQPSQVCLVAEVGRGRRAPKVPGYQAKPRGTRSCQPAAPHLTGPESWEHRRREVSTQVRQASPAAKVGGPGGRAPHKPRCLSTEPLRGLCVEGGETRGVVSELTGCSEGWGGHQAPPMEHNEAKEVTGGGSPPGLPHQDDPHRSMTALPSPPSEDLVCCFLKISGAGRADPSLPRSPQEPRLLGWTHASPPPPAQLGDAPHTLVWTLFLSDLSTYFVMSCVSLLNK